MLQNKQRLEEEERKEREREIERRKIGRDVQKLRQKQQDLEMKQAYEERMREKAADAAAREKVLQQIAQDKLERKQKELAMQQVCIIFFTKKENFSLNLSFYISIKYNFTKRSNMFNNNLSRQNHLNHQYQRQLSVEYNFGCHQAILTSHNLNQQILYAICVLMLFRISIYHSVNLRCPPLSLDGN